MPQQTDQLSPEKLQLFLAGLAGLPPDEIRKAKLLYIRDAVSEYKAMKADLAGFAVAQGCFMVIPFFWPILWAQKKAMVARQQLANDRIDNAIDVWRAELRGERFDLGDRQIVVE